MGKTARIFILIVAVGLIFAGAVSAAGTVDLNVTQPDLTTPVVVATEGDNVDVVCNVQADNAGLVQPYVNIDVNPAHGLGLTELSAEMSTNGGATWISNNPSNPSYTVTFFYWYDPEQVYLWDMHWITGNLAPNTIVSLRVPGIVNKTGQITLNASLYEHHPYPEDDLWIDDDLYTFLSIASNNNPQDNSQSQSTQSTGTEANAQTLNSQTLGMQNTGMPLAMVVLALLAIFGGAVYGKIK